MQRDSCSRPSGADDPATLDLSGRCVGSSYVLIRPVGHGATGTVWLGIDRTSGDQVAVKLLHGSLLRKPKLVARFVQERTILTMLRHEHVVGVRDLFSVGESLGLVMDFVSGGSLRDQLRSSGNLAPGEAARLLAQVVAALGEAHSLGVVHRDVKPDNILLHRQDGRLDTRLTDFGIARVLDTSGLTTPHAVIGTPHYMAPEAINGSPPSPAADVYAVGVVLYELLTGHPPYRSDNMLALLGRHLDGTPEHVDGMPDAVWAIIKSCMDADPQRRPSATQLTTTLRDLARLVAHLPALPARSGDADDDQNAGGAGHPAPSRSVRDVAHHPSSVKSRRVRRRHNRPRSWLWSRPGVVAALAGGTLLASGVAGFGGQHLWNMSAGDTFRSTVAPPSSTAPVVGGTAPSGPARMPPDGAPTLPTSLPPAAAGIPAPASSSTAGREESQPQPPAAPVRAGVSAARVSTRVSAGPGAVAAGVRPFGPWRCGAEYRWDVGHPVLAKPCYSIGGAIRVYGDLQASPGVQADVSLTVQDAETDEVVAGPHTCEALMFTDSATRHRCGPVDLHAPSGRRYVVVESWQYTARPWIPGGETRGPEFTW